LDKVSGVSMVPKGIVNLGSSVVRFYEFIKNPSVVSMLGWILVLGLPLSFFEVKSTGCCKIP